MKGIISNMISLSVTFSGFSTKSRFCDYLVELHYESEPEPTKKPWQRGPNLSFILVLSDSGVLDLVRLPVFTESYLSVLVSHFKKLIF